MVSAFERFHCIWCPPLRDSTVYGVRLREIPLYMVSALERFHCRLINKSVILEVENKKCVHKLPFTANPETRLMPNEAAAKKVLNSQIKLINKSSEEDKKVVIEFEQKLQDLDYVDYVDNLDEENKNRVLNSPIKYYIP